MTTIWQMSKHPLEVKGAKSETRWAQPRDEIFSPLPTSIAFVAITTGGKTSQMLHVTDRLFNVMDRIVIFRTLTGSILHGMTSRSALPTRC